MTDRVRATGSPVEAVLLDAAGTIITPARPVGETYAEVAHWYGASIRAEDLGAAFFEAFSEMPVMAFPDATEETLRVLEHDWWHHLVHRVMTIAGGGVSDFDGFFLCLYGHFARGEAWRLYPEVKSVLSSLKSAGYGVAMVSNFDSRLPGILEAHGIHGDFDHIVYSTKAGVAKPAPGIFEQALDAMGAKPEHAVHVGDSHEADYLGSKALGMEALLLVRDSEPGDTGAAARIPTLEHLLDWLRQRP